MYMQIVKTEADARQMCEQRLWPKLHPEIIPQPQEGEGQ